MISLDKKLVVGTKQGYTLGFVLLTLLGLAFCLGYLAARVSTG
jgi:hypothetical protein